MKLTLMISLTTLNRRTPDTVSITLISVQVSLLHRSDFILVTAEQLLNNLTASFDQKMRLLLDPNYQAVGSSPTTSILEPSSKRQLDEARNLVQQARQHQQGVKRWS